MSSTGSRSASSKLLIVGLDGATMDLVAPWVAEGKLPNLARMMEQGVYGVLRSTKPYITPTAWSSFATGLGPGRHGVLDFYQHRPGTFELYFNNSLTRRGRSLWGLLSDAGKKVCVINVPMTYPPEEVNGVLVSGMDAPGTDSTFTYPEGFYDELLANVGEYLIDVHLEQVTHSAEPQPADYRALFEAICHMTDVRLKTSEYLMGRYPWDLFVTVFYGTDRAQHQFWKFMDPSHPDHDPAAAREMGDLIYRVYRKCDDALGRLLQLAGSDTNVMVMSDHGAGPCHTTFYVRNWLRVNGYLRLKHRSGGGGRLKRAAAAAAKRLFKMGKKYVPRALKSRLKARIGKDRYLALRLYSDVDWEATRAYSEGVCGYVFVNLKGREPHGIVEPGEEYEKLCEQLLNELKEVRDPETGERVVRRVYRREEFFAGPHLDGGPDLIVEGEVGYHCRGDVSSKRVSTGDPRLFEEPPMSGTHDVRGAFLALGPYFKRGHEMVGAGISDICPTALHLLGEPVPEEMDGRVLTDALGQDYLADHPIERSTGALDAAGGSTDGYDPDERRRVESHLRGLGYLE